MNPIRHYDLTEELWSNDRATGSRDRTARDINSPSDMSSFSVNLGDNNMDSNYEEANDYVSRSPATHFQSSDTPSDTPSNTPSMASAALRAHPHLEDQREKALLWTTLMNILHC